jgi:glutathione S-transferase
MRTISQTGIAMASRPVVFGTPYSVYVRAVQLTLEEKGVGYHLEPVDVFAEGGPPSGFLERHPFGRIPAFEHDGFRLYETGAITRYVDEAFPGPALQPATPQGRGKVNQLLSSLDAYVYRTLVWDIHVERISKPKRGQTPDEARIQAALTKAQICLRAVRDIMGNGPFLAGEALTLADCHAAPMFAYFMLAPEAGPLLEGHPRLGAWWQQMAERRSLQATALSD